MDKFDRCYTTNSPEDTYQLGKELGLRLTPGSMILLSGDLGSGKTVFVQGMASGMEVPKNYYITSPTYTLINEYPARLPFFHVDLFRLETNVDLEDIGLLEYLNPPNVMAIEWAERLKPSELPSEYCQIRFVIEAECTRTIQIIAYGLQMIDLLKDMPS